MSLQAPGNSGLQAFIASPLQARQVQLAWYVVPGGAGREDGTSWADAFAEPQDAVDAADAAVNLKEVWVKAGTYLYQAGGEVLRVKDDIAVYGGFAGTEDERDQRDWATNQTILDGEDTYNCVRLDSSALLDGLIVENGYEDPFDELDMGAGVKFAGDDSTLRHCIVHSCEVAGQLIGEFRVIGGAGIFVVGDNAIIENCLIHDNDVYNFDLYVTVGYAIGAGIYLYDGGNNVLILNCTVENNHASGWNLWGNDAGIAVKGGPGSTGSTLVVTNTIVYENWRCRYQYTECVVDPSPVVLGGAVTYSDIRGGYAGAGNINADPLFVGAPDYHIPTGSPCKNAGTATGAPDDDLDGNVRPYPATAVDMGAYEYQGA